MQRFANFYNLIYNGKIISGETGAGKTRRILILAKPFCLHVLHFVLTKVNFRPSEHHLAQPERRWTKFLKIKIVHAVILREDLRDTSNQPTGTGAVTILRKRE